MLQPDQRVGPYRIVRVLGHGGMGTVYEVEHELLQSRHALKVLDPKLRDDAGIRQRFLHEARIQARHKHPHLVSVTDIVHEPDVAGFVMELLDGDDLDDWLAAGHRADPATAVEWTLQVLDALQDVHAEGIVHRDLKPSNLFVVQDRRGQRIVLTDFGIAKHVDRKLTRTAMTLGTVGYMSPEQIQDPSRVDARTDLFSLGAILYELLAGQPAFAGDTDFTIMRRVTEGERAPLDAVTEGLPPALVDAVERALATDPDDRFADAAAFADALSTALPGTSPAGRPRSTAAAATAPPERAAPAEPGGPTPRRTPAGLKAARALAVLSLVAIWAVGVATSSLVVLSLAAMGAVGVVAWMEV